VIWHSSPFTQRFHQEIDFVANVDDVVGSGWVHYRVIVSFSSSQWKQSHGVCGCNPEYCEDA